MADKPVKVPGPDHPTTIEANSSRGFFMGADRRNGCLDTGNGLRPIGSHCRCIADDGGEHGYAERSREYPERAS
jgi:hypothetical protein